jgi:molybdopterin/thiamine biosynthesis adenylyltransferase
MHLEQVEVMTEDRNDLTMKQIETYSRQIVLDDIGYAGQKKIRDAKICVLGLGGLGSPTVLKLVAMGVGYLRIVDRDVVSRSDLHRQTLYDVDSLGIPKVEVAGRKLCRLNPDVDLDPIPASLNSANVDEVLKDMDVVVDGFDRITPRYIVNRACQKRRIPYIFGSCIEYYGNVSSIVPGKTACLECFYPDLDDDSLPKCAVVGVHPSVPSLVSCIQVLETINFVVGNPLLLENRLLYVDLKHLAFDAITLARRDNCPVCGPHPTDSIRPIEDKTVEETCARDGRRVVVISPKEIKQIDPRKLRRVIESKGMKVDVVSHFAVTFGNIQDVRMSVLRTGVLIAQIPPKSIFSRDDINKIYQSVVESAS